MCRGAALAATGAARSHARAGAHMAGLGAPRRPPPGFRGRPRARGCVREIPAPTRRPLASSAPPGWGGDPRHAEGPPGWGPRHAGESPGVGFAAPASPVPWEGRMASSAPPYKS